MSIALSIKSEQLGLRLLELPLELISLLESSEPPTLHLKSSNNTQAANAVLCTPDRTFEVCQVQSSNVLYILQQTGDDGYTTIAQCKGMLELVPSRNDAKEYLEKVIPVYAGKDIIQSDVTSLMLSADAPFSEQELKIAAKELCVFVEDGKQWIPAPIVLGGAWKSLLTASTINGVHLDQPWSLQELEAQIREDGVHAGVYRALSTKLSNDGIKMQFDPVSATTWVGQNLLESQESTQTATSFVIQWQDILPEYWRDHANLTLLQDKCIISPDGTIKAKSTSIPVPGANKPKLPPKSKWHEKFRK